MAFRQKAQGPRNRCAFISLQGFQGPRRGKRSFPTAFISYHAKGGLSTPFSVIFFTNLRFRVDFFIAAFFRKSGSARRLVFSRKPEAARPWLFSERDGREDLCFFQMGRGRGCFLFFKNVWAEERCFVQKVDSASLYTLFFPLCFVVFTDEKVYNVKVNFPSSIYLNERKRF